jgi:hypothetical protein
MPPDTSCRIAPIAPWNVTRGAPHRRRAEEILHRHFMGESIRRISHEEDRDLFSAVIAVS